MSLSALTDAEGRYDFTGLADGLWTVTALKAGFVLPRQSLSGSMQPTREVRLAAGQRVTLNFALPRSSAISGTILDGDGEPVAGVRVMALRTRMVRGRQLPGALIASDATNDTGAFRLHSLPAGDYIVSALWSENAVAPAALSTRLPTYYPGTASLTDAARITVREGEERADVTFTSAPARQLEIRGSLTDASGRALKDVTVELLNAMDYSVVSRAYGNFGMSKADGGFTFAFVDPGSYLIAARHEANRLETALHPVSVATSDVAGVLVATSPGTRLTGTLAVAAGATLPRGVQTRLVVRSVRDDAAHSSPIDGSGGFSVPGLLGRYRIDVEGLPAGWMVDSVTISGQPVADRLIEFGNVELVVAAVTVTDRGSELSGRVAAEPGRAGAATVIVFSADPARWSFPSRYVRAVRTEANGAFRLRSLPPSEQYFAIAVDGVNEGEVHDPELLARLRSSATPLSLGPAERRTLNLRLGQP